MPQNTPPQLKQTKIVYNGFFDVREDLLVDCHGDEHHYCSLVAKADGVIILPALEINKFLLTLEYRYPIRKKVLSCPGGRVSHGEDPLIGAKRELLEEMGYEASVWTPMGFFYPFPSACDQKVYVYLAQHLKKTAHLQLDPLEEIETKTLSLEDVMNLDYSTCSLDGALPTALLLYKQHLEKMR